MPVPTDGAQQNIEETMPSICIPHRAARGKKEGTREIQLCIQQLVLNLCPQADNELTPRSGKTSIILNRTDCQVRRCDNDNDQPACQLIEGEDWEDMFDSYKVMSWAVGVKKPQEAQKAKALWKMKAAKDRKEEFNDPANEEDISRRNKTRLDLWEEHLKDPIAALDKALKCVESQY